MELLDFPLCKIFRVRGYGGRKGVISLAKGLTDIQSGFTEDEVKKQARKLLKIFKGIKENEKEILKPVIEETAFLIVAMKECKRDLLESGLKTVTINASQSFAKANPLTVVYNNYIKNLKDNIKLLLEYSPKEIQKDELESFLNV